MKALEKARIALRRQLQDDIEKVRVDLERMRNLSNGFDINSYIENLSDTVSFEKLEISDEFSFENAFEKIEIDIYGFVDDLNDILYDLTPPDNTQNADDYNKKSSEIFSELFFNYIWFMEGIPNAAFSFEKFKVSKFFYDENNDDGSPLKIGLIPKGSYNSKTGEFTLDIEFFSHNENNQDSFIFNLTSEGVFKFESNIEFSKIPKYFYRNAIAIMFPYLRAFISTLTLQANTKLLKIGLLNLSSLEQPLKENSSVK